MSCDISAFLSDGAISFTHCKVRAKTYSHLSSCFSKKN